MWETNFGAQPCAVRVLVLALAAHRLAYPSARTSASLIEAVCVKACAMRPCANKDLGSCIMPVSALVRFTPSVCQASATTSPCPKLRGRGRRPRT
eukprot:scaffold130948_cov38-Phaeocystis_antarctica.AAC.1